MIFSEQSKETIRKRYLLKDTNGNLLEDEYGMLKRVANYVGQNDKERQLFYDMMSKGYFLPNSPTLMNAGEGQQGTLSACFVVDVEDDMDSIFKMIYKVGMITKASGGVGCSFSKLRHRGARVNSSGGKSSGVLSFMSLYNKALEVVEQGGKRKGAGMAVLDCDHPEIEDFIKCKRDKTKYNYVNISVAITNKFMEAVRNDLDWHLLDVTTKETVKTVKARDIYNMICENAHATGEPGIIFIDRVNRDNHFNERILASNPCSEQYIFGGESCNLASINLLAMYNDGQFNEDLFSDTIRTAVRFLDNVIDANSYPLPEIEEKSKAKRRIGLGVMGFADLLYQMKIKYGSKDCLELIECLGSLMRLVAYDESEKIGKEKGYYPDIEFNLSKENPRRNAQVLSIAPTGTISFMLGVSSGIEPNFNLEYTRNIVDGGSVTIYNKVYKEWLDKHTVKEYAYDDKEWTSLIEELPDYFVTTNDITTEEHINVVSKWQEYIDNGISKTVNLSNNATIEQVEQAYMSAWEKGCKGVTVYRDGSRDGQVLVSTTQPEAVLGEKKQKRPFYTNGKSFKLKTACGSLYLTINEVDGKPFETFINLGHKDGCVSAWSETTSRLLTQCLRGGADINKIIKHLTGIQCCNVVFDKGKKILSCSDAIGKCLADYYNKGIDENIRKKPCPDCSGELIYKEGCITCNNCGYSKCGG